MSKPAPFKIFLRELGEEVKQATLDTWMGKMDEINAKYQTDDMVERRDKVKKVWWYK